MNFDITQIAAYSPSYWGGSRAVTVSPAGASDQTVTEFNRLGNQTNYKISGMYFNAEYIEIDFVDTIKKVIFSNNGSNAIQGIRYPINTSSQFFANNNTTLFSYGWGSNFALVNIAYNSLSKFVVINTNDLTWNPGAIINPNYEQQFYGTNIINNQAILTERYQTNGAYVRNGIFYESNTTLGPYNTQCFQVGNFYVPAEKGPFNIYENDGALRAKIDIPETSYISLTMGVGGFSIGQFFITNTNPYYICDFLGQNLGSFTMPDGSTILGVNSHNELITTTGTWSIKVPAFEYIPALLVRNYCHNYSRGVPVNFGGNLVLPKSYNVRKRF